MTYQFDIEPRALIDARTLPWAAAGVPIEEIRRTGPIRSGPRLASSCSRCATGRAKPPSGDRSAGC